MKVDKIKAYVGFAIKSKSILFGLDKIKEKKVEIIIFSEQLSKSSTIDLRKIAEKNDCKCIEIKNEEMLTLVGSEKVKAFAIQNKELAKAIESNI